MAEVITLVTGAVALERVSEVRTPYEEALAGGPPPTLEQTFLLRSEAGRLAILSVWHRRADLEAMIASGEEPFARRLIRQAGGTPEVTLFEVLVRAGP